GLPEIKLKVLLRMRRHYGLSPLDVLLLFLGACCPTEHRSPPLWFGSEWILAHLEVYRRDPEQLANHLHTQLDVPRADALVALRAFRHEISSLRGTDPLTVHWIEQELKQLYGKLKEFPEPARTVTVHDVQPSESVKS